MLYVKLSTAMRRGGSLLRWPSVWVDPVCRHRSVPLAGVARSPSRADRNHNLLLGCRLLVIGLSVWKQYTPLLAPLEIRAGI